MQSKEAAMDSDASKSTKRTLPPLPKWELIICFVIWVGHAAYAWYVVWKESSNLEKQLWDGFFEPGWRLLNYRRKDVANFEWNSWFQFLPIELATFFLHSTSMRIAERLAPDKRRFDAVMLVVWIVILRIKLGWIGVATTLVHGGAMLTVARVFGWKPAVWICACCLLATLATDWYPLDGDHDLSYRFAVYVAYKLLHFLSFCLYDIDAKRGKIETDGDKDSICYQRFSSAYYALLRYTLYPPYAATLIVTYPDYVQQWTRRSYVRPNYKRIAFVSARLIFWTFFNDFILHFVHNNAMVQDPYLLREVDLVTLCAVGYTAGQYFHMKYVSIFGVNTVFALLDGMTPANWPPICISRVALYSNMWRYFDRGLYAFLRDCLFMPIAVPTFSFWRRSLASLICFAFVWLWHGLSWGFFYWVGLNFVEVSLENVAKEIYALPSVFNFVNSRFSPVARRRGRAMAHVICVAFGIFSIFYFLAGASGGHVFVQRLVIAEGLLLKRPLPYLLALGYFFSQCCMEVEAWMDRIK